MSVTRALSATQAARLLGMTKETLKKRTEEGLIPYWFKTDTGRRVYSEATIEAHQRRAGELAAERGAA